MDTEGTLAQHARPKRKRQKLHHTKAARTTQACLCQSIEEFQSVLKDHLSSGCSALIPELVTCHISFAGGTTVSPKLPPTRIAPTGPAAQDTDQEPAVKADDQAARETPVTVSEATSFTGNVKESLAKQRAVARGIGHAVEAVDGNRYHINNIWTPKNEEGHRFGFCCQDSKQNKDRLLNKHKKRFSASAQMEGRGNFNSTLAKPTYDCEGSITIKFSREKQCIDLIYNHIPIHRDAMTREDSNSNHEASEISQVSAPVDELVSYSTTECQPSLLQALQKEIKETSNGVDYMHTPPSSKSGDVPLTGVIRNEATITNILSALKNTPNCEVSVAQYSQRGSETMVAQGLTAVRDAILDAIPRSGDVYGDALANGTPVTMETSPKQNQLSTRKKRARTGCFTCKERSVKCDEGKPTCKNCSKKSRPCSYPTLTITHHYPQAVQQIQREAGTDETLAAPEAKVRGKPRVRTECPTRSVKCDKEKRIKASKKSRRPSHLAPRNWDNYPQEFQQMPHIAEPDVTSYATNADPTRSEPPEGYAPAQAMHFVATNT